MRGAGRAIAWEFGWRHRFGLAIFVAYLAAFVAIKLWVLPSEARFRFVPPNEVAILLTFPLTIAFLFFVGVFTYGLAGDLGARESIFPKRLLALPVKTSALAGWPMLYGVVMSMMTWIVTRLLAHWAGGDSLLPWLWPALLLAVWLAWMQALTWMPYGLRNLRVVAAIAWLVTIDAIVLLAGIYGATEATMVAILAPQLPLAYLVAWYAVGRARHGEVPDWSFSRGASARRERVEGFRTAARAQAWLEWRRHGWTLPSLVGAVVPFELLLLFIPGNDTEGIVFAVLILVMITPPVLALFASPAFGSFTTFAATRPLSTVALVAAKLRVAMASTLTAWMLAVAFSVVALVMTGMMPVVVERLQAIVDFSGVPHGAAILALPLAALVASTWKGLVQSLCIGLTGRMWLIRTSVLVVFALLVATWPLAHVFARSEAARFFAWDNLPWIIAGLVCAKLAAASWVAVRLHAGGIVSDRMLVTGAALWLAAVVALYAFLEWIAAAPIYPLYFVAGIAILFVPLARVSAAPLALAWSRHR
jgi:hypothetical protein